MRLSQSAIRNPQSAIRSGFTLIELLVVIAIIGTLLGILIPSVMKAYESARRANTRTEIGELELSMGRFKAQYGFYPPSQIKLCERGGDYGGGALDVESKYIMTMMFPELRSANSDWNNGNFVDWDGNGAYSGPVVLTGDQCLVFFLGGIPAPAAPLPSCKGFSRSTTNPSSVATIPGNGPMFNFLPARLVKTRGNNFYSYKDYWGNQPYAYFSSYRKGYNSMAGLSGQADCPNMGSPYMNNAAGTFYKPDTCQIISAGKDGTFGLGSSSGDFWPGALNSAGAMDDQANFATYVLGGGS